jgi:glycosyltransferase involved in cell wall biosynthesis
MEGMARGLAIVATDVGAIRAVVDSTNGILLNKCSLPELQAALIKMSHMDTQELLRQKKRSLEKIAEFTWDKIAERTANEIGARLS